MSDGQTVDGRNIQHLEECPGCPECTRLLDFYMACDGCGAWGNQEAGAWHLHDENIYCERCNAKQDTPPHAR